MRLRSAIFGLLLFAAPSLRGAEILDRIVANVNGNVILQSDWDDEVNYECFMSNRCTQDLTQPDRNSTLSRLIDQELLREQMRGNDFKPAPSEDIDKQVEGLKQDFSRDHPGKSWNSALASYGLSESDVRSHVTLELNQLRLIDARLRPSAQINPAEVENYYRKQLLPKSSSAQPVTLQDAAPKIREVLTQQKIDQLLGSWLETLRSQAQIHVFVPEFPALQVAQP
jgi:peptidyl-prolyl cis-trans isomerase SurA